MTADPGTSPDSKRDTSTSDTVSLTPVERLRLFAISVAVTLFVVLQDSGRLATDTKLDLVVDPGRFLAQAFSLWDPLGEGGRIQNQAYGYLFPMGPFFLVGDLLDFPPWATQRLWESALLVSAFVGTVLLARRLGVRSFWSSVACGLTFALTPRVLSELMFNSAELLPTMILPWVILPLVRGAETGSPRRAAALSGLAFVLAGGTNAGASLAILPVAAIWLLTRQRGRRRSALIRWWVAAVVLASTWWAVPLLLLGRYSPPFLEWIEAAENTTITTSMFAALRGVPHWVSYLGSGYWPAGWDFVTEPSIIVSTGLVAAIGLVGLARSSNSHRVFLFGCLACGLIGVTFGHASRIGPPFDGVARELLDGPLIPFRNVHKFQGLITLPLAVGLGLAFDRLRVPARGDVTGQPFRRGTGYAWRIAGAGILGAVAIGPAVQGDLVSASRTDAVASWWAGASRWLASQGDGARALIVPGAPFPTYLWGETIDEAIQPVARSPWVVRSAVPLAQPGLIRLLDVFEWRLASGRADDTLATLLARSGIRFVVVRNDLNTIASDASPQSLIRLTLRSSPGFELVASVGPSIGQNSNRSWLVDNGAGGARPAIEIFEVEGAAGPASLLDASRVISANGTSDSLAGLVNGGIDAGAPVLFGDDADAGVFGPAITVATDGIRRQQDAFGGPFRRSGTMTSSEQFRGERNTYDYLPDDPGPLSTFEYLGVADIRASSSGADVRAVFNADPSKGPWSAFDDDPRSAWRPASWGGAVGEWIEVRFVEPLELETVTVLFDDQVSPPARLEVTTDEGSRVISLAEDEHEVEVPIPPGPTSRLRFTFRSLHPTPRAGGTIGIASINVPGLEIERTLNVPEVGDPDAIRFEVAPGHRSDCVEVAGGLVCGDAFGSRGEEDDSLDRSFTLDEDRQYELSATVRWTPGEALDSLLDEQSAMHADASSTDSPDGRHRAGAAVDGDPATAWVAAPDDDDPRLELDFGERRAIDTIRLDVETDAPVARPTTLWIHTDDTDWIGPLPRDGLIRLPDRTTTERVEITILDHELRRSISMFNRFFEPLPTGINEVRFGPAVAAVPASGDVEVECGDGLSIVVDGQPVPVSVTATRAEALAGVALPVSPCDESAVTLSAGDHRITLAATNLVAPVSLELGSIDALTSDGSSRSFSVVSWQTSRRHIEMSGGSASVLVVHENFNEGWVGELDGRRLDPVRVDGWQQGFVIPEGAAGTVVLSYAPQRVLVAGLLVGGAGVVALLVLAFTRGASVNPPPTGERSVSRWVALGATVAVATLLAGAEGAGATAFALAAIYWLAVPLRRWLPVVGALLVALAAAVVAASDQVITQADAPAIQAMCVVGVAASFAVPILRGPSTPPPDE